MAVLIILACVLDAWGLPSLTFLKFFEIPKSKICSNFVDKAAMN